MNFSDLQDNTNIANRLEYTFEQQIELQLKILRKELTLEAKHKKTTDNASKLYKTHIYEYLDGYIRQYTRKNLLYILKQLAEVISTNIKALSNDIDSSVRTASPIRCLTPSERISQSEERSKCSENIECIDIDSDVEVDIDDEEDIKPTLIVINISSDEEEEDDEVFRKRLKIDPDKSSIQSDSCLSCSISSSNSNQSGSNASTSSEQRNIIDNTRLPRKDSKPYYLPVVDRKHPFNYYVDKLNVLCLKPINEIRYKMVGLQSQAFMLHVIAKVVRLISTNSFMSKRELYYRSMDFCKRLKNLSQSQTLPQSQSNQTQESLGIQSQPLSGIESNGKTTYYRAVKLDDTIDDLCCLLGCSRIHLHIVSQAKGLVFGNLVFTLENGEKFDALSKKTGLIIPSSQNSIVHIEAKANFVLIVEKDSVFQKMLNLEEKLKFLERYKCILFTAKGFPDIDSRAFIKFLWTKQKIPILIMTDADPFGVDIMCCYKYGSYSTAFDSSNLAVPQIKWLGLLPSDIQRLSLKEEKTMPLTTNDEKRLNGLINRPYFKREQSYLHQINLLRELGRKAELEALDFCEEYLVKTYLPNKLRYASWL